MQAPASELSADKIKMESELGSAEEGEMFQYSCTRVLS